MQKLVLLASFLIMIFYLFFFGGTGVSTQGFTLAKQVLYH
jgi:hypothetical protein